MHQVLVVGAGSIGERHVRCFLQTRRAQVSVCEVDDEIRARIEANYEIRRSFSGFGEALASTPDVVVVATPAHFHVPMALQAGISGCHVLIEKPLSITLEGIEPLGEMAAGSRVVLRVAYVLRHHPAMMALHDGLDAGSWGRALQLTVVSGQHFPAYRPAYREIYYARHGTGGGAIQDGLTHLLDAGQWWLGPIDRLTCDAGHVRLEGVKVEDSVNVLARHGEMMATYLFNQHQFPNETTFTLCCQDATVRVDLAANKLLVMKNPAGEWDERSWPDLQRDDLFVAQAHAFLDAVEGKESVSCTMGEAIQTLRCQLALLAQFKSNDQTIWTTPSHA